MRTRKNWHKHKPLVQVSDESIWETVFGLTALAGIWYVCLLLT